MSEFAAWQIITLGGRGKGSELVLCRDTRAGRMDLLYSLPCLIPFHDWVDLRPLETTPSFSFLLL